MKCPSCQAPLEAAARFCGACGKAFVSTETKHDGDVAPAGPPDMTGREIAGRYRIGAKLGEGGMGAVSRAEQIALKRAVALKLLRPEMSRNPLLLRRFNAEAELVAKLSHPNTVTIYDYGQDADGSLFIAMELIEGPSLRRVLRESGPLPVPRALAIAAQLAASLADAHAHGIIHRDLKPDNAMLQERGKERDVVRVLDFGIAKLRDDSRATQQMMTQAGDMLGTPQYMAPEQIRGEDIDGRTDVYALGCILYEMVTGRMPFEAVTSWRCCPSTCSSSRCRRRRGAGFPSVAGARRARADRDGEGSRVAPANDGGVWRAHLRAAAREHGAGCERVCSAALRAAHRADGLRGVRGSPSGRARAVAARAATAALDPDGLRGRERERRVVGARGGRARGGGSDRDGRSAAQAGVRARAERRRAPLADAGAAAQRRTRRAVRGDRGDRARRHDDRDRGRAVPVRAYDRRSVGGRIEIGRPEVGSPRDPDGEFAAKLPLSVDAAVASPDDLWGGPSSPPPPPDDTALPTNVMPIPAGAALQPPAGAVRVNDLMGMLHYTDRARHVDSSWRR